MLQKKYTTRNRRPSYAFLMEMLWVCGFFAVAACIFVLAFVKADSMSRRAEDLNQAVMAAENEMEQTFLLGREGSWIVCFDDSWNPLPEDGSLSDPALISDKTPSEDSANLPRVHAALFVDSRLNGSLLNVTINAAVMSPHQETIYTLEGSHMMSGEILQESGKGGQS